MVRNNDAASKESAFATHHRRMVSQEPLLQLLGIQVP